MSASPVNLREVVPANVGVAIFDMDDLMINSHPLHMKVFETVLNGYGVNINDPLKPWTAEDEMSMFGLKISDAFKLFIKKYALGSTANPDQMSQQFDERMLPVFEAGPIEPMSGLTTLIEQLGEGGVQLALASSARRRKIDLIVEKLGLETAFKAIVAGEDEIQHGKPAPDIFLEAARKLGRKPMECMALEDARNGIESINAAGMFSIGVHNQFSEQRLGIRQDLSGANLQVSSLADLSYQY